ncbi:AfsR/SARP family transcriptional regulator [Streptomyces sp. HD1123-B1]|uniref:AfsR/SARP family transcriptional regulator n=1 Tax=Streptomyces huangiella TaxID=3228804 RepID=UPI003D7DCE57
MYLHLLGPVGISDEGHHVNPRSTRARGLLAALAVKPNEVVPDDVLIGRIWDDRLPENPLDALYTCAKRLRKAVGEVATGECVVRRRGGYELRVEPLAVDVFRFRRAAQQAARAAAAGNHTRARELYAAALSLWSGTPLADVIGGWAERTREVLHRERLAVQLAEARICLRLGRHATTVARLDELAADHPTDEGIGALLMLALHRSGRRAEALGVYTRTRRHLVENLGVEPGGELRELHRRLLRGDASLDRPENVLLGA